MNNVTPIRTLSHGEEVYAEVTAFLRSPEIAAVDYVDLPEAVLSRWPSIPDSDFEADIAWRAVVDEIERCESEACFAFVPPAKVTHVQPAKATHASLLLPFPEPSISEIYERIALEEAKLPASERALTKGWPPSLQVVPDTDGGADG